MTTKQIKFGTTGFGRVGNYDPTTWRYMGTINGSHRISHVKHPSQSVAYPDTFATNDEVARLFGEQKDN